VVASTKSRLHGWFLFQRGRVQPVFN